MAIKEPYYRITRIKQDRKDYFKYTSELAAQNRPLIRSFKILEKDFINILDYIEPSDANLNTYSHRIYELYLRACTEFETNAKEILLSNNYNKNSNLNVSDYYKLNKAMKLSEFKIKINIWENEPKYLCPFEGWSSDSSLGWYRDYNKVKHNRSMEFKRANLSNLTMAISAVQVILYAQFTVNAFSEYNITTSTLVDQNGYQCIEDSIFSIKFCGDWADNELYSNDLTAKKLSDISFKEYAFD